MKTSPAFLRQFVATISLFTVFQMSSVAQAAMPICVRNYISDQQGFDACQRFPQTHAYVQPLSPEDKPVCARMYASFYCDTAQEYHRARSLTKGVICVMNFNQPPVANYCQSVPQFYNYISANMEE